MLTTCKIDPEKREGPSLEKKFFQLFRPKFGLKMDGGGGVPSPGSTTAWQNINQLREFKGYLHRALFVLCNN